MKRRPEDRIPCVVSAKVCGPYSVFLVFDDGVSKQVNLRRCLKGPVFKPMHDPADFAPETLYELPDERDHAA